MVMAPDSISYIRIMRRTKVVFPAPECPIIATFSPGFIVILRSLITLLCFPKLKETFLKTISPLFTISFFAFGVSFISYLVSMISTISFESASP